MLVWIIIFLSLKRKFNEKCLSLDLIWKGMKYKLPGKGKLRRSQLYKEDKDRKLHSLGWKSIQV